MSLGTLTINLLMKTGQFETDTKRAERRAKQMAAEIDKAARQIGLAFGAISVAGVAASIGVLAKSAIQLGDELFTVSERTGVSVENLGKFALAATQAGTNLDAVGKGLTKLNKAIGLQDENAELMKQLGVDTTSATTAMLGLADVFKNTQDPAEKAAIALQLFGKSGVELVPLLSQGREEIERTSVAISTDFAKAADDFGDSIASLKSSAISLASEGLNPIIIALSDVANGFAKLDEYGGKQSGYGVFDIVGDAVRILAIGLQTVVEGLSQTWYFLGQIAGTAKDLLSGDFSFQTLGYYQGKAKSSADNYIEQVGLITDRSRLFGDGVQQQSDAAKIPFAVNKRQLKSNRRGGAANANIKIETKKNSTVDRFANSFNTSSASNAANASAKASLAAAAADRAAAEAKDALSRAAESLNQTLDAQAAELGGPLVQAAQQYRDKMVELQEAENTYTNQGKLTLDVQNDLNLAREQALTIYQQETSAIQSQLSPADEQLKRMKDALRLLKLTNDERVRAAFLIDNPGATGQAQDAVDTAKALIQTTQTIQAMDQLRSSAADAFKSVIDGSSSAKDAFTSFADSVLSQIANIIAQNLAESLFGSFGTTGGGTGGGDFLSKIFGSFFGGGLAGGGQVQPGKFYRVNENQPEVLSYRGEDFLMNAGGGMVKQNSGGNRASNVTINLPPSSGRRSELQAAQRAGEETRRALARNA